LLFYKAFLPNCYFLLFSKFSACERPVNKTEVDEYQQKYGERLISSKLVAGKPIISVFDDTDPGEGFAATNAGLEEVFFSKINGVA